jgi:nucleoside-diphosphate-sugar epimerase
MTEIDDKRKTCNILITGGAGFLGKAIVKEFLDPSALIAPNEIRIFDTKEYDGQADRRIMHISGDVRDYASLASATRGIDIVIHSAAIVDWGTHSEKKVYDVNFTGTENIIKACEENKIKILIYTSSLDAVYTGKSLINIDERQPYPDKHPNMYCESKALSEVIVVKANSETLKTCVLRPSDIYGEADPFHMDSLINMARGGFYVRLGDGRAKNQHVYVGNMANAHLLVVRNLLDKNKKVEGNVYFITDGPAENFFTFFDQLVLRSGYRIWPENFWLPRKLAYAIGSIFEFTAFLFRPVKHYNPKFSRFAVTYTCTDFIFSSQKAKNDFGYEPKYSFDEAIERTVEYYRKK